MTSPHPAGHAIGLSVQVLAGSLPSQRAVISVAGHPYELAGSLSSALVPGPWQLAGFSEGYAVFTLRKPPEPITAATASGRRLPVQVISSTTKSEEIRVDAPASSTVIRSVAWDSGWTATVSVNGGKAQKITVDDFDLVQQVHIPPGDDVVSFHYRPPHLLLASVLSLGAVVLLLALLGVWLTRRRGRHGNAGARARTMRWARWRKSRRKRCRSASAESASARSAEGVGQGQEELAVFRAPHPFDHEAGF